SAASEIPEHVVADQSIEVAKDSFAGRKIWERLSRDLETVIAKPWKVLPVLGGVIVDSSVEFVPLFRDAPHQRFGVEVWRRYPTGRCSGSLPQKLAGSARIQRNPSALDQGLRLRFRLRRQPGARLPA